MAMTIEIQHTIRQALVEDSNDLALLARRAFTGYPFEYVFAADGIKEALQKGERRYVMLDQGRTVGSAVLGINDSKMAEIMRVMIDPLLRRNGAATILTRELAIDAIGLGKYAWADVRGDQVGMQRAALGAGMKAISLEQGKHVVYHHYNEWGIDLGAARETMVHMTTLPVDELDLKNDLARLDPNIRKRLAQNLKNSLEPSPKDPNMANTALPSASETKDRVLNNVSLNTQGIGLIAKINQDIIKISIDDVEIIVILPDASAFILTGTKLHKAINLLVKSGVQVATYYCDLMDTQMQTRLIESGMEPVSVRPWVHDKTGGNVWQIAWRKTANDYDSCLHTISLDRIVERQILKIINIIEK